jgi:hypothetical protein
MVAAIPSERFDLQRRGAWRRVVYHVAAMLAGALGAYAVGLVGLAIGMVGERSAAVAWLCIAFGVCLGLWAWSALAGGMAGTLSMYLVDYSGLIGPTILIGLGGVAGIAVRRALIRRVRARAGAPPR